MANLSRLYEFLASANPQAAAQTIQSLTKAPARIGERLDEFEGREVRRLLIRRYGMRYELISDTLYVLRIWRTREHR
ncbi:MAG TPA: type II toxin-antitoxin system RelE/ParE family toxin [Gammaproteobacteria bacterium]|nr:type II toxin-antitoxin system RelE/ParE family toxin [Gammaproteobacteria bacterium]